MKKFCISLYIILACVFLVSCTSSSVAGNSEPVEKLPPELEKLLWISVRNGKKRQNSISIPSMNCILKSLMYQYISVQASWMMA